MMILAAVDCFPSTVLQCVLSPLGVSYDEALELSTWAQKQLAKASQQAL